MTAFLYTNNEIPERKYAYTHTHTHTHTYTHLGINLTKQVKELYVENYKTLIQEIKKDSKKWKDSIMLLEELALLKWPYYPKQSTDLTQVLSNHP